MTLPQATQALKLVKAKADLLPGAPVVFDDVPGKNYVFVEYTLWDGRTATEQVGFDQKGPYLVGLLGERWRYRPSARRPDGELVREN